jgi:SPP1 family predicted phage head-tail adaptor
MTRLKNKKIEILELTRVKDSEGFTTEQLAPIAPPLWAYYRHLSGKEIYASGAEHAIEDVLFVVNWREGLNTQQVIRYRGQRYDIKRIDNFQGYKQDIALYCKVQGEDDR